MTTNKRGAPLESEAPVVQVRLGLASTCYNNYSSKDTICKPPSKTLSGQWNPRVKAQLQIYLGLGLIPIPLRGKIPQVKWRKNWNPKTIEDLEPYKNSFNWGIRTGGGFAVIDFDSTGTFTKFIVENLERLPDGIPIVKTGRGYHIWFRPTEPLRDAHYQGIDIKGEGGQVVAPPSIHPRTNRPYRFLWQLRDSIPELDINTLVFPELKKRGTSGDGRTGTRKSTSFVSGDKPKFDFNLIKDGVGEGGEAHGAGALYRASEMAEDVKRGDNSACLRLECKKPPPALENRD